MESVQHKIPHLRIFIPVWGKEYIDRWYEVALPSLLSPNNLPYLANNCKVELFILTKQCDIEYIKQRQAYKALLEDNFNNFILIDEYFPPVTEISYGVPLTLAYAKGINALGREAPGAYAVLLNSDFVLSDGSLKTLLSKINEGYDIIAAPSIRATDEHARSILEEHIAINGGKFNISGRELLTMVSPHFHPTVLSRTLNNNAFVDPGHYHVNYWRVSETCLAARYFLLMPLCFKIMQPMDRIICPVDYGFIAEACPNGNYTVLNDSDSFLILELQTIRAESNFLRPALTAKFPDAFIASIFSRMSLNIRKWATKEHCRAARHTIYFHWAPLTDECKLQAARFETMIDVILDAYETPVSHIGHYHWLGALQGYRISFYRDSANSIPFIIDDKRNNIVRVLPGASGVSRKPSNDIRRGWLIVLRDRLLRFDANRDAFGRIIEDRWSGEGNSIALVVHVGDAATYLPERFGTYPSVYIELEAALSWDLRDCFVLSDDILKTISHGSAVVIALSCTMLSTLARYETLIAQVRQRGGRVVVAAYTDLFKRESFITTSWPLAYALCYFPPSDTRLFVQPADLLSDIRYRFCQISNPLYHIPAILMRIIQPSVATRLAGLLCRLVREAFGSTGQVTRAVAKEPLVSTEQVVREGVIDVQVSTEQPMREDDAFAALIFDISPSCVRKSVS